MSLQRMARVVAGVVWVVAGVVPLAHAGGAPYVGREEKTFSVSGTPDVTLRTFDGGIQVRTWNRREVHVTIERHAADESDAKALEVDTRQDGNRITVDVRQPAFQFFSFGEHRYVNLIVSVPATTDLSAHSGDGEITVDGVSGRIGLDSGDGRVAASNLHGDLDVHTGDGSVRVDGLQGTLHARSGDGSVHAGGRLSVVDVRTGDGSVTLDLDPGSVMSADWQVASGDGSISVGLPPAFDAEVDAHTGGGTIALNGVQLTVSGRLRHDRVHGTLGKGGHLLTLHSGDGSVSLHRR